MLKQIINKWDPINLFPNAPDNEYEEEIIKIHNYIKSEEYSELFLGEKIYEIFLLAFEEEIFHKTIEECKQIALEITRHGI